MQKQNSLFFILIIIISGFLSSCASKPYIPASGPYVELEIVDASAKEFLALSSSLKLDILKCQGQSMGVVELNKDQKAQSIKINANKPFYTWLYVHRDNVGGGMHLSFVPRADLNYRILYKAQAKSYTIDLQYFDRKTNRYISTPLKRGLSHWKKC